MIRSILDRALVGLRDARARVRGRFVRLEQLGPPLLVEAFDAGFAEGDAAYNSLGRATDGTILFVISSKRIDRGARLFAFDPPAAPRPIADLDAVLPRSATRAVPQGKVHVDFVEIDRRLHAATHIGYYDPRLTVERPAVADGYAPYPGGWFFAVDGNVVEPLAQAPAGQGILAMSADVARRRLVALTWPRGLLLVLDLTTRTLHDYGPVFEAGETGRKGRNWQRICRSIGIDPESGAAFWSYDSGDIARFDGRSIERVAHVPGGGMWRRVAWHPCHGVFYGITRESSTLFRFDPARLACEPLEELRAGGRAPATLAFALDESTIHILASGPGILRSPQRQLASSVFHIRYDLATGKKTPRGPLSLRDGRFLTQSQSLLMADGTAYSLCWVEADCGRGDEIMFVRFDANASAV